jgi:hypothetical protein
LGQAETESACSPAGCRSRPRAREIEHLAGRRRVRRHPHGLKETCRGTPFCRLLLKSAQRVPRSLGEEIQRVPLRCARCLWKSGPSSSEDTPKFRFNRPPERPAKQYWPAKRLATWLHQ